MSHNRCPGPLRRRDLLGAALGLGALNFGDFALAAPPTRKPGAPDTSLIVFWMWGGPSQHETFDPKPEAPEGIRGPFKAIDTKIPGVRFCELFPKLAGVGDRLTVVRSLHHTMASHNDGSIELLTAKTPEIPDPTSTARSKHPDLGMIVSKVRGLREDAIPQYVGIPNLPFMTGPNYLGVAHKGFTGGDPTQPDPTPSEIKLNAGLTPRALDRRNALLAQLEGAPQDGRNPQDGFAKLRQAGVELLTRPEVATAFDISKELSLGVANGACIGLLMGVLVWVWRGNFWLGLVIAAAMQLNLVAAALAGVAIPLLFRRFKRDPAQGSGVFVTMVTDVCGFFFFLGLATLLISRLK